PASITIEQVEPQSQAAGIALVIGGALVLLVSLGLFYRASSARRKRNGSDDDASGNDPPQHPQSASAHATAAKDQDAADDDRPERADFTGAARSVGPALTASVLAGGSAIGLAGPAHAEDEATDQPQENAEQSEPADAH